MSGHQTQLKRKARRAARQADSSRVRHNGTAAAHRARRAEDTAQPPLARPAYARARYLSAAGEMGATDEVRRAMPVSQPADAAEHEAERMAADVTAPEVERSVRRQAEEDAAPEGISRQTEDEQSASGVHRVKEDAEAIKTASRVREDPESIKTIARQGEQGAGREPAPPAPEGGVSPAIQARIETRLGAGRTLPEDVRRDMERRFGADFRHVHIHTDGEADDLAHELRARAFTVGSDVFFRSGEYQPETETGKRLLAHELTHVLQNRHTVQRRIMRDGGADTGGDGSGASTGTAAGTAEEYRVQRGNMRGTVIHGRELSIPRIHLPRFKRRNDHLFTTPLTIANRRRPETTQRATWAREIKGDTDPHAEDIISRARNRGGVTDAGRVFLRSAGRGGRRFILTGTEGEIRERIRVPNWDRDRHGRSMHVDHVREMQLGGSDVTTNYELLDGAANMSSGARIANEIEWRIRKALELLQRDNPEATDIPDPDQWGALRYGGQWTVKFDAVSFDRDTGGDASQYWSWDQVKSGHHVNRLVSMSRSEVAELGEEGSLHFFATRSGGQQLTTPSQIPHRNWLPRVDVLAWTPNDNDEADAPAGSLQVKVFENARRDGVSAQPGAAEQTWNIKRIPGIHGGYVDRETVEGSMRSILQQSEMSPIALDSVEVTSEGILAEGRLLPTIPLIRDADIRLRVMGADVELQKTFSMDEISLPPPFEMKSSELTVSLSARHGIGVRGRADFGIQRLGEGYLAAAARADGFELEGRFDFDSELFDPARVSVSYRDQQLTLGGQIGIPGGKVRGIKSAQVDVSYTTGGSFSATGEAELDVPGVQRGTLFVTHTEAEGFSFGGSFELSPDVPGIRSGSVTASVSRRPDGEGYAVSATGEAEPDIPGIDSRLTVTYDDGVITAETTAAYSRGMLSGRIEAGATNRALDEQGNPSGEPGEDIVIYGGGSVTVQIAPWLEGTVGIRLSPEGEVTVSGEIGLPSALEIFPRAEIDKPLPGIDVQIPIVPGIVAEVGGRLTAVAGIGPGTLDQLRIGIEYNPEREEETHVTGNVHLRVPADAGLRMAVRAGIGLGITGASATGGLEVGGQLGVEGAAEAGVAIDWTPATGLDINADLSVHAQPSFTFDISGYVSVKALGFSVYDERWELASYRFGSDYRFGISLPLRYHEGEPFDVSVNDIEFEIPDISPRQVLGGLIDRIA